MHSNLQQIHDIAAVCFQKGISHVVLSPGSRCAPITVSFVRHPHIETFVIPDERSAAFIALGMALETKKTVALVCTSGTAALNYYPAIAEAFYQQVPLLILTADRPPELIDMGDGQTIRQENVYANHIKKSFSFPIDNQLGTANQLVADAIDITQQFPQGPVHINIPIREPFYPSKGSELHYSTIELTSLSKPKIAIEPPSAINFSNALLVIGQQNVDEQLRQQLEKVSIPVIVESISNLHQLTSGVFTHDLLLSQLSEEDKKHFQPDLLISYGNAILSKALKQYLRTHKPKAHWNFADTDTPVDVFQSITHSFPSTTINNFNFSQLTSTSFEKWKKGCKTAQKHIIKSLETETWNEFSIIYRIIQSLPDECILHVGNSMSIRYVNYLTFLLKPTQVVRCNRGTSGIDGSISTAVGSAICSQQLPNIIITGDLSFFYDRNAFWHKHLPNNLHILLMNNHGGGIFRMIDGPANLPEHETYFETPQSLNGKNTASDFNFDYSVCTNYQELKSALPHFFGKENKSKLLEVETNTLDNTAFFKQFKQTFNSQTHE